MRQSTLFNVYNRNKLRILFLGWTISSCCLFLHEQEKECHITQISNLYFDFVKLSFLAVECIFRCSSTTRRRYCIWSSDFVRWFFVKSCTKATIRFAASLVTKRPSTPLAPVWYMEFLPTWQYRRRGTLCRFQVDP